jgi:glutamate dehydrogenase
MGREKYTAIIDGSGVVVDPHGLDREELVRLAHAREMISGFDTSKLSKEGFRVLIDEMDVKLPSGEVVPNGMTFRNTYHLRGQAQCFVPCGGRPEAVDISNVHQLIVDGKSKFAYIVEGANLYIPLRYYANASFLTQEAKLRLEKAGAIVYKDASANKGGVTSSSLEGIPAVQHSR